MAEGRHSGPGNPLDIEQILIESQSRWLTPAKICEILRNYKNFRIDPEPANMPPSGSLFLFDRNKLRNFRKDGHNWTKKRDGKTVMEGHEKLRVEGVVMLNCYYAHGEENKNFLRRSYWLLQRELSHVALVHYREVKGNRKNFNCIKETEEAVPYSQETEPISEMDWSVPSCFLLNNYQATSQSTDTTGLNSAQALEHVDTESAGNHQASSGFHPFFKLRQPMVEKFNAGFTDPSFPGSISDDYQGNFPTISGVASLTSADTNEVLPDQENPILGDHFNSNFGETGEFGNHPQIQKECQTSEGKWPLDHNVHEESVYGVTSSPRFSEQVVNLYEQLNLLEPCLPQNDEQEIHPMQNNLQVQLSDADHGYYLKSNPEINMALEGKINSSFTIKQTQLDGSLTDKLKKLDSFNRWMSKELGDVNDAHTQSSSGAYCDTFESENRVDESNISPQVHLDIYTLGPSLSQDQLFSIIDFSPNWAYEGSKVKVLITGRFLKSQQEIENCKWSCMFGEVEVPAEVIADGVIRCHTPVHKAARVPFYVTCCNRLACSEVQEFEYRVSLIKDVDIIDYSGCTNDDLLMRFKIFLSLTSAGPPSTDSVIGSEKSQVSSKISSSFNDEWDQILKLASEKDFSPEKVQDKLLGNPLKEKLHVWLLQKAAEGGKGPSVLDENGQGVLHFAAALGYDWALKPTIIAGVSVNFRDVNGWTALHWAAFCGREWTVTSLVSLGAAPGALTDPSPKYPSGRTAADLASANGHKGIAGYLAGSHLSTHLSSLKLGTGEGDAAEISGAKAVQKVSELQQPMVKKINARLTDPYFPRPISDDYQGKFPTISVVDFASLTQADKVKDGNNAALEILDFPLWEDALGNGTSGTQAVTSEPSFLETKLDTTGVLSKQENPILGQHFTSKLGEKREIGSHSQAQKEWQASEGIWHLDQNVHAESVYGVASRFNEQGGNWVKLFNSREPFLPKTDKQDNDPMQSNLQVQLSDADHGYYLKSNPEINMALEGKTNSSFTIKKTQLDGSLREENLKKLDSFNGWMSEVLGDVNESHTQSSSEVYWDTVESENRADESSISPQVHLDNYTLGPSLSQDQLFSIIDFSPKWAYEGSKVKVLITGRFLKSQQEIENCKWSCMFGEVEVPAEVIADGVIRCHTPVHKAARVPFYVTCSNRVACSEVREFEYRVSLIKDVDIIDYSDNTNDELLMRFKNFLSLTSAGPLSTDSVIGSEKSQVSSKISSLLEGDNDEWDQMLKLASEKDFSPEKVQDKLLEKLLKEKLHVWLLQKAAEDGKGPSVVDENGQGVLHFAAALGYDWALKPTIIAGVSVNFRDVNGWTALHWAAFCGRERTVASLVSLGAAPSVLTDPCPKYPSGRTAADLASANGHKGISGYLAESHLSTHLSSPNLDTGEGDAAEISGAKAVQKVSERSATPVSDGDLPYGLSLKDSLAAVCNATQTFARIYQVFRVESFNKKQLKESGDDTFGMSDEEAPSLLAVMTNKSGQHDLPVHAAAIRIQNKFRSWKCRQEFLIIRQRIVKIQAHVRGHQVRKNYKKFTWSVGIIEKLILRWRRKGSGLRGFKAEALTEGHRMQDKSSEDDYDFLKEGRKQTEQRLQKALARVKSMAQYPDARDQYRRVLNVVTDIQGSKVVGDGVPSSSEETADYNDEMIDFEAFLEDDTYMPSA